VSAGLQGLSLRIFGGLYESYDKVAAIATLMQDRYWKTWVTGKAAIEPDERVLDIGCGTGLLEEHLAGVAVSGLDLNEAMVRIAQRKRTVSLSSLSVGDAEHLPFRASSFEVLLSCYVVKYCDSRAFIAEMMRVLRPGGRFLLYDFTRPSGPLAPFLAFYEYGVLRIFGAVLRRVGSRLAFTFEALPSLISKRRWDDSFAQELRAKGFSGIGSKRLSGGAVTVFWATKPSSLVRR
jgi:demethylmenaquinone methyltransferase / 2-methoxy-6-polyprenyl-1,4-benzoquinol methylase